MAGPISDKFGRRDSIAFACLWWLLGTAVQVSTHGVGQLIAGRILNGVCVGITSSQVPVYLAEIAKKDKRGSIVVIQQLAIELGILIMYFIGEYQCALHWPGNDPDGHARLRMLVHRPRQKHRQFQNGVGHAVCPGRDAPHRNPLFAA
jgi:MFS family permease